MGMRAVERTQRNTDRRAQATSEESMRKQAETQGMMQNYVTNPNQGFTLYGNEDEKAYQAANLSQAGVMTGVNMFDVGGDAQQYRQGLKDRLAGADPVSEYMMQGRNRNMANVGRTMSGRGVAGGVASAALSQAQREADAGINAQMFENQVRNQKELNALNRQNQTIIGNALAAGSDRGLADNMSTDAGSGITLICTELKRQGILPIEVQAADHAYGLAMWEKEPIMMAGYTDLAGRVVPKMQKSKLLTSAIAFLAVPWAYHIAGSWNIRGAFVNVVGKSICRAWANYQIKKLEAKLCR
jgi:hypothetical protein